MKRKSSLALVGVLLLAAAFSYSTWRVLRQEGAEVIDPNLKVIRFAHWQLEPGVREALDEIAADYMALHPKVRVEQMSIPGQAWMQWLRTQLVGGKAPDLIELANYYIPDDILARYFIPLTSYLEEPNPYNADEPDLRGLSWRRSYASELVPDETGMMQHYYYPNLMEYYGAPSTMVTLRVFYNRRLLKAALGEDRPPQTFDEFLQLCAALQRLSEKSPRPILPLAGSIFNITKLTDTMFGNATQKLAIKLDYSHNLELTRFEGLVDYMRGRWSLDTPAVRTSLEIAEALGKFMPPGWVQLKREDAMLEFLQEHAAMLATGTWDAGGILQQAKFEIGAFKIPPITRDDPRFGRWALGPTSEANTFAALPFGLTSVSRHPERAIDFLRFLTSRKSNAKFSRISTWLPVIKGVPVPAVSEPFRPISQGYIAGLNLRIFGSASIDVLVQNMYLLSGNGASVDRYVEKTRGIYDRLVPEELTRLAHINQMTIRQKDSALAGFYNLAPAGGLARSKFDVLAAKQLEVEAQRLQWLRTLADYHLK